MDRCLVTRLEPERARSRRMVVELDHERLRLMPASLVTRLGLEAGDRVDPAQLAEQTSRVEPELARERALYLISYRERSAGELLGKLANDGYDEAVARELVADLESVGLIDDARFSESLVRMLAGRGYGRSRVARELSRHCVDDDLITSVLEEALPADDELERALEVARRSVRGRCPSLHQLVGRLARKGFGPQVAFAASRQVLDEAGAAGQEYLDPS